MEEEEEEETGGGLQRGIVKEARSFFSHEHPQNDNDKLVLPISLGMTLIPGSLTNETMPCRQRGHGIEPGGPLVTDEEQFMVHRYNAHLAQNS